MSHWGLKEESEISWSPGFKNKSLVYFNWVNTIEAANGGRYRVHRLSPSKLIKQWFLGKQNKNKKLLQCVI